MNKIKNIEKAAERIKRAAENKEKIIIYADSDLDGIASAVILHETIKNLEGNVISVMFPDRENDGYGINLKALEFSKKFAPALFITLDLGIGNVKEIEMANKMGFEVIVVDHHEQLVELPKASIIVDPKQKSDSCKFKELCNGGLTLNLCREILGRSLSGSLKNSFLELAALATISDMVPQIDENKIFVEEGLRSLKDTFRPGLKAFFEILGRAEVIRGGFYKIISALNAAESVGFGNKSFDLLTCSSHQKCIEMVQDLIGLAGSKQMRIKLIIEEVEKRIAKNPDEAIIFEGDPAWRLMLAGSAASTIVGRYGKPVFVFRKMDKESAGSVRSPKGFNSVDAMRSCADLLITYGGHAMASGFRLKNENLEKFKKCLIDFTKNKMPQ